MVDKVPADMLKRIYDNAKYVTVGGLHKRAQRFFDAMNSKIKFTLVYIWRNLYAVDFESLEYIARLLGFHFKYEYIGACITRDSRKILKKKSAE